MKVTYDFDAYPLTRAHPTDAGLDVRAKHAGVIPPRGSMTFGTGVHIQLPPGTVGLLLPKSGLMVNRDLLTFGVIDEPYRGEIMVHVENLRDAEYIVRPGDKISQLIIVPVRYEAPEPTDALDDTDRGARGFGSTGR